MNFLNIRLSVTLLAKRPIVTLIKIAGLTIGVAVATLLMVYADQEMSYDKHFEHSDRIYRTLTVWKEGNSVGVNPICLRYLYEESAKEIPEVEAVVQIFRGGAPDVRRDKESFRSKRLLYADPEFEEVFTPVLLSGNINKALSSPGMLVITDRLATTIFGDEQAIGQNLTVNEKEYTVEAVIQEFPYQTHFRFDMLAAMTDLDYLNQLGGLEFFTYTLFKPHVDLEEAQTKCIDFYTAQLQKLFQQYQIESFAEMEPIEKIHLSTKAGYDLSANGDKTIIISLSLLALLILALALTNYINLYIVHSESRSLEIGIRRASGSGRIKLIRLFFSESLLLTLLAFLFALIILHATAGWIKTSFGLNLNPDIWTDPVFYLKVGLLMLITAALGGVYPALYLSKINPVRAIYPASQGGTRKGWLTRAAVVLQFAITVFLLVCVGFLTRQMNYISKMPLGFSPQNVMTISNLNSSLVNNQTAIREELKALPHVLETGASQGTPASGKSGQLIYRFGDSRENGISIAEERVQPGYFKTLGIELLEGRTFRDGYPYDRKCVILNETAVQKLALDQPVGSKVVIWQEPMEVIGVVKNFHFSSLKSDGISPLVFTFRADMIYNFMIKVEPGYESSVQADVKTLIKKYDPDQPVNISFMTEQLRARYRSEYQLSKILTAGAVLGIILSVMGLFAMSLFVIHDRIKEIGVRKVLGASVPQVTFNLTWSILKWSVLSIPLGAIPAYLLMNHWINNFAYKTDLSWWMFIPAGLMALGIALITVIVQIIRVGRKNPVHSLRYE